MRELLGLLRAAGEETRLRILAVLATGELTVSELTQVLGQSQPRISRHLRLMVEAGLLERFSEGAWAFYRITANGLAPALTAQLLAFIDDARDDDALRRDRERLAMVIEERAERAAAYFRRNAAQWDEIRALHVPEVALEEAVAAMLPSEPIGTLLDIGTGTGRMLELLGDRVRQGIGIDISHDMLEIARTRLAKCQASHLQVRQGDMYGLAMPDGAADCVLLHLVLHYADRPDDAIREAARVLKPGGCLLIVDFAPHDHEFLRTQHAHRRLGFNREEVTRWFADAGLALLQEKQLQGAALTVCLWRAGKSSNARSKNTQMEYAG